MQHFLLFVHILGVAGLLIALGVEYSVLHGMLRATSPEELRASLRPAQMIGMVIPISVLLIVVGGVAMVITNGRYSFGSAWIIMAIVLTVVMSISGPLHGEKIKKVAISAASAKGKTLPRELAKGAKDSELHTVTWLGFGILCAILFLMSDKPGWLGSILATAVGIIAGYLVSLAVLKASNPHKPHRV